MNKGLKSLLGHEKKARMISCTHHMFAKISKEEGSYCILFGYRLLA